MITHGVSGYTRKCRCGVCVEAQRVYNRARTEERRAWLNAEKDRPCADCGVKYPPYVMDFDHVRGKKLFNIGMDPSRSVPALEREIAKCEVVCSNCHRERTHQRRDLTN